MARGLTKPTYGLFLHPSSFNACSRCAPTRSHGLIGWKAVIQWFADRADLIIIMFDAHKLDISDELRVVMDALRVHQVRRAGKPGDGMEASIIQWLKGAWVSGLPCMASC